MTGKHRIVVSTENSAYQGWQAKLFYYSCVTRLEHQPIFIVHESGERWHPDFCDLVRAGAIVRRAPSYILPNAIAPRNTAGTLLHAASLLRPDEFIVLCDPDMIFVRKPEFPQELSANYYSYMRYQRKPVEAVAAQFGIGPHVLKKLESGLCVGVPYVIPAADAVPLAELWLRVFDTFSADGRHLDDIWQDIMYAFGIAALKLGWKHQRSGPGGPRSTWRHRAPPNPALLLGRWTVEQARLFSPRQGPRGVGFALRSGPGQCPCRSVFSDQAGTRVLPQPLLRRWSRQGA